MNDLILRGLELAAFGMGTVFVFLTLLVLATMGMSALVLRLSPDPVSAEADPYSPTGAEDPAIVAAIGAAVRRYRQEHSG